jgi:hypothetical protein
MPHSDSQCEQNENHKRGDRIKKGFRAQLLDGPKHKVLLLH